MLLRQNYQFVNLAAHDRKNVCSNLVASIMCRATQLRYWLSIIKYDYSLGWQVLKIKSECRFDQG